ncbi:adenylate cyclase, partial [Sinorhizobium meliloti]
MAGPHYRLQTFGELRLVNSGGVAVACPERGALILAYLCVSGEKTASREKLAMLIWPEREKSVAFKNLRSTLWRMRHLAADLGPLITATEAEVTLGEIACDVDG